jgi:type VI secretion system lysozyme-like protein
MKGARASLFERLTAQPARGGREKPATQDYASLVAAVVEELGRLLNTRCHVGSDLGENAVDTVLDYGVPDLVQFSPANESDQRRLAELLEHKIAAYEPRLRNVRIVLASSPNSPVALQGRVSGSLRVGSVYEPVSFPLAIDGEGARLGAIHEGVEARIVQ